MAIVLIVLAVLCFVGYVLLHQNADKSESQFSNRTSSISDSSRDLFTNQKYAIVGLLAYIQGSTPKSAYNEEANNIVQSTIFSLGLSRSEVEKYLKVSMNRNPDEIILQIVDSLKEIRDRHYLENLYQKSLQIAKISGDTYCIETTNEIFRELGF